MFALDQRHVLIPSLLVALAAGAWWWLSTPGPTPTTDESTSPTARRDTPLSRAAPLRCTFDPGDRLAYSFSQHSTLRVNPRAILPSEAPAEATPSAQRREIAGEFLWRVLEVDRRDPGRPVATLAGRYRNLEPADPGTGLPAAFREAIGEPVLLRIDDRCRFRALGTQPTTPGAVTRQWQLAMSLFEFVGPASPDLDRWSTSQRDSTGTYVAAYRRSEAPPSIERRRREYLEVTGPAGAEDVEFRARMLGSDSRARGRSDGAWLASAEIREEVEVTTASGDLFATADTRAELAAETPPADDPLWRQSFETAEYRWHNLADLPREMAAAPTPTSDAPPANATAADVLETFRQRREATGTLRGGADVLIAYLRRDPAHAGALFDELLAGGIRADERAVVFFALERTGNEACRDVLIEAVDHPELESGDRLRAISALSDLPRVDGAVVEALETTWRDGDLEAGESRAALLAAGRLAGRSDLPDALRARTDAMLRQPLDEARTASSRRLAIEAIGNGGTHAAESFGAELRRLASSGKPALRASAHETLRRLGVAPDHPALLAELADESHPAVRHHMSRRLVDAALQASPAAVDTAADMLAAGAPTDLRHTLVDYLGLHADDDPRAREALVAHFARESDVDLLVRIGRYVAANEL